MVRFHKPLRININSKLDEILEISEKDPLFNRKIRKVEKSVKLYHLSRDKKAQIQPIDFE
jgi:hypothetical protein